MWLQLINKSFKRVSLFVLGILGATNESQSQLVAEEKKEKSIPINIFRIQSGNYFQNGTHSAITGGIGTERLEVFANNFTFSKIFPDKKKFTVHTGIDIISSPSTDAIDSVVSSSSLVDYRSYLNLGYEAPLGQHSKGSVSTGMSIESDYLSFPIKLTYQYTQPDLQRSYEVGFNMYFDDLRWGRLNFGLFSPRRLVYPSELRSVEWHNLYLRQTYDLSFSLEQVLNQRSTIAFLMMASIQNGLLSTPFHRVYFSNDEVRVENLPDSRIKIPLGIKWNQFIGSGTILKLDAHTFWDNFGIKAQALDLELVYYVKRTLNIKPHIKYYRQSASKYFKAFGKHDVVDEFYTSDYDLSKQESYSLGVAVRLFKDRVVNDKIRKNDYEFRYSYYNRSDGLHAHIITIVLNYSNQK